MVKTEEQLIKKELRRTAIKAFKIVEKMMQEEPHPIVYGGVDNTNSDGTVKEITAWLFHRSRNDDSERNTNSN